MKQQTGLILIALSVALFFGTSARAQHNYKTTTANYSDPGLNPPTIRPSLIPVIIGILSMMFFLMFLILAYAKFCHRSPHDYPVNPANMIIGLGLSSRFSGIDKRAIESLPFFHFSTLKGSKQGLECSVCLSKFEDSETLRLLPHCNHAFHMSCIDRWFEGHSSCPICRHKFSSNDFLDFSSRFPRLNASNLSAAEDVPNVELFIQREEDRDHVGSSRRVVGSSFGLVVDSDGEGEALTRESENIEGGEVTRILHKMKHKIIVSDDVAVRKRWSDVNSSDLIFLKSEMIGDVSSQRFVGSGRFLDNFTTNEAAEAGLADLSVEKRSMSEITNVSRFASVLMRKGIAERGEEAKAMCIHHLWLARRQNNNYYSQGRLDNN